ncbi:MAG: T9SS type A sorting domain-containing protein [Taibaiella sp.]|nr:T9SS type A sorting domain-containing protein [Taibaiella sp.]
MKHFVYAFLFFLMLPFAGYSANYYWVGGAGNWSDINHWATTSGGSTLHAIVPSASDNVFFDANSGLSAGATVTIDVVANCHDFTTVNLPAGAAFLSLDNGLSTPVRVLTSSGSLNLDADASYNTPIFMTSSVAATVTANGADFKRLFLFNGTGTLSLTDSCHFGMALVIERGTFNTNNVNFSLMAFSDRGTGTKTIDLGTSTLHFHDNNFLGGGPGFPNTYATRFGFRVNQASTAINALNAKMVFDNSSTFTATVQGKTGLALGDIIFNRTNASIFTSTVGNTMSCKNVYFAGTASIGTTGTFTSITMNAGQSITFPSAVINTITDSFHHVSNPCSTYGIIKSLTSGTQATLSMPVTALVNINRAIITDISVQGGASFIANNAVDGGNNTGWTINSATPVDYYWVGGAGDWQDGTHWSLSSGGAPASCVPGPADNVFFDAGSGLAASSTVTTSTIGNCYNLTVMPGVLTPITIAQVNVYGSLTSQAGVTHNSVNMLSNSTATIDMNGGLYTGSFTINGAGVFDMLDSISTASTGSFAVSKGTLNTNNHLLRCHSFNGQGGSGPRTLNFGSSNIHINAQMNVAAANTTIHAGTSHIHIGGLINAISGQTFYDVSWYPQSPSWTSFPKGVGNHTGTVSFNRAAFIGYGGTLENNNIFSKLILDASQNYLFEAGFTQSVTDSFAFTTPPCATIGTLHSTTSSNATLSAGASCIIEMQGNAIKNITATGGATFTATNCTDQGGNSGWVFTAGTPQDFYWIGGDGNWGDGSHWAYSTGGTAVNCVPGPNDNVFFDANSGLSGIAAIAITADAYCRNITISNTGASALDFAFPNNKFTVNGSLTGAPNVTFSGHASSASGLGMFFASSSPETISSNSASFAAHIYLVGSGSWSLQDSLATAGTHQYQLEIRNGMLMTNNHPLKVGAIVTTNNIGPCGLTLGSSNVYLYGNSYFNHANFTLDAGTSHIYYDHTGTQNFAVKGGQLFYDVTTINPSSTTVFSTHSGNVTYRNMHLKGNANINDANVYENLQLTAGKTYSFKAGSTQTINQNLYAAGNPCFILTLKSLTDGSATNICVNAGNTDFDFANVRDLNASCQTLSFGANSTNISNNTNITFAPYAPGSIEGIANVDSLICSDFPYTLVATGFYANPGTTFSWSDGTINDTAYAYAAGTFWVEANYGDGCVVRDSFEIEDMAVPAVLVPTGETVSNLTTCLYNGYDYYQGPGAVVATDKAFIAINVNGNTISPTNVTVNNEGDLTGGSGTFTNSGSGYYQSTDATNTFRISKRLASLEIPGTHAINGGVIIRVYYDNTGDLAAMQSDVFPGGASLVQQGWFKYSDHTASGTVAAMTPDGITGMQFLTPTATGMENGLNYAEFIMETFSTIGYFAASDVVVPLPLKLLSFDVVEKDCQGVLTWQTADEKEFSHFDIEFSSNERDFVKIATTEAGQNTGRLGEYSYKYASPELSGLYRLKLVDQNQSFSYSPVKKLAADCTPRTVNLFPNPTSAVITVEGLKKGDLINICDALGKQLATEQGTTVMQTLDLSKYPAGIYFIHITSASGLKVSSHKLVKQ